MGSLVSTVTDAVGLTNVRGEERARKNASAASDNANAMARENLAFQKEQYAKWQSVYGDIQENLGEYYKNLGPDRIISLGLQNSQLEHQQAEDNIRRTMAQRGLGDSKFEAYTLANADIQNAHTRAQIRNSGQELANQQKMQFLGLGLNQGQNMLGNIGNAANMATNSLSQQSNMYNQQFQQFNGTNSQMLRSVFEQGMGIAGTAAGGMSGGIGG